MLTNFKEQFKATLTTFDGSGEKGGITTYVDNPLSIIEGTLDMANSQSGDKYYHYCDDTAQLGIRFAIEDSIGKKSMNGKLEGGSHCCPGTLTFDLIDEDGVGADKSTGTMTISDEGDVKVNMKKDGDGYYVTCGKVEVKIDGSDGLSTTWKHTDRHTIIT